MNATQGKLDSSSPSAPELESKAGSYLAAQPRDEDPVPAGAGSFGQDPPSPFLMQLAGASHCGASNYASSTTATTPYDTFLSSLVDADRTALLSGGRRVDALEAELVNRRDDFNARMSAERLREEYHAHVFRPTKPAQQGWYFAQIVECARALGYFADTRSYREWLRLP